MSTTSYDIIIQLSSLRNRFDDFVSDAADDRSEGIRKLQALMLIYETHRLAELISTERATQLIDYFERVTLHDWLACVREVDRLLWMLEYSPLTWDDPYEEGLFDPDWREADSTPRVAEDEADFQFFTPDDMTVSQLWSSRRHQTMGQAFYRAYEEWNGQDELEQYTLHKPDARLPDDAEPTVAARYLMQVYSVLHKMTDRQIYDELVRALEVLRITLMQQADDVYGVRTGDWEVVPRQNPSRATCDRTDYPFVNYRIEREEWRNEVTHNLEHKVLDEWRWQQRITRRPLNREERIRFLSERREAILRQMQEDYPKLWSLRERSGGYDTEVNAENFARMFYARKGTDRTFFRLQWELEYIDELLLTPHEAAAAPKAKSPEEQAMSDFVEKLTRLAGTCHERWHGRRCPAGAHQPEVTVEIRKDELIRHLDRQLADTTRPLLKHCYPVTNQSKRQFCHYVTRLIKEGYFGKLPKKELAAILAPIVGMSEGTVKNYLSKG